LSRYACIFACTGIGLRASSSMHLPKHLEPALLVEQAA